MTTDVTTLPSPELRELNAEIKALMGRYDVSQTAVADLLGIKQPGVSARLRGVVPWKADELLKLAEAFGVHPAVLFGGQGPGPDGGPGTVGEARFERATFRVEGRRSEATVVAFPSAA